MKKTIKNNNFCVKINDINFKINEIHPLLELKREELFEDIKMQFMILLDKHIGKEYIQKMNISFKKRSDDILSRFIMNELSKNNIVDPLIPYNIKSLSSLEKDLKDQISKIREYTDNDKEQLLITIMKDINLIEQFNKAFDTLEKYYNSQEFNINKNVTNITLTTDEKFMILYYDVHPVYIYRQLYDKIMKRFAKDFIFDKNMYIWCLCKRYSIISSYNNQLAVHPQTMKFIKEKMDIEIELFGSVFNTYNKLYCSMFYDIEKYFGSLGSFFDMEIIYGNFSMNPPFDNILILNAIKRLNKYMKKNKNIFTLIWIPIWDNDGINNVAIKCLNSTKQQIDNQYKKQHGIDVQKKFTYHGYELIKKSEYNKYIRIICTNDMSYINYVNYNIKHVANTYLIAYSTNKINHNLIDSIQTKIK
jgi:hypothetical protein